MEKLKLKIGLGVIPFFGFIIILFWGMLSVYAVNRNRKQVFLYGVASMIGMLIIFTPIGLGIYFFILYADLTNTALVLSVLLLISLVGLYLMTAVCLAIQYLYCKKLVARQNMQYLS